MPRVSQIRPACGTHLQADSQIGEPCGVNLQILEPAWIRAGSICKLWIRGKTMRGRFANYGKWNMRKLRVSSTSSFTENTDLQILDYRQNRAGSICKLWKVGETLKGRFANRFADPHMERGRSANPFATPSCNRCNPAAAPLPRYVAKRCQRGPPGTASMWIPHGDDP